MKGREGMVEEVTERKREKRGKREGVMQKRKTDDVDRRKKWEGLKRGKEGDKTARQREKFNAYFIHSFPVSYYRKRFSKLKVE